MAAMYRELPRDRTPAALADAVVWWRTPAAEAGVARVVPDGCLDVIWADGSLFVAGPDTRAHLAPVGPPVTYVGIRFTAGSGPAALGVPADELRDTRVPLDGIWPPARVRAWERALATRDWTAVGGLVAPATDRVSGAVWRSLRSGRRVDATAGAVGLSARQLHRRCLTAFGYGPKTLGRILRFDRAVALARTGAALADVAATSGYADQAHLSREVRELAGVPLTELLGTTGGTTWGSERGEQVDPDAVRIVDHRVTLPPERVPRGQVSVVAGRGQLGVPVVDLLRVRAPEGEADPGPAGRWLVVGVERTDRLDRVEREAQAARQRDLHVRLGVGLGRYLQPDPAVEGERGRHVGDRDADHIECRCHGADPNGGRGRRS